MLGIGFRSGNVFLEGNLRGPALQFDVGEFEMRIRHLGVQLNG